VAGTRLLKEIDVADSGGEEDDGHVGGIEQLDGLLCILTSLALRTKVDRGATPSNGGQEREVTVHGTRRYSRDRVMSSIWRKDNSAP
jgi:hypothetical protein